MHTPEEICGDTHPEQWGKSFYTHSSNHGFVGDIFTVNGVAFPRLRVFRRRYRFRFLDASVARIYELCLMSSAAGPQRRPGTQGQYQIPDGLVATPFTQIAIMGGLLPTPLLRDSIQIWPASRNEHVIDFSQFPEGTVLYLTNILEMPDGRKPKFHDPEDHPNISDYKVPMVKIIVGGLPPEEDLSVMPQPGDVLRPMPSLPDDDALAALPRAEFVLHRSGNLGAENQWQINDKPFDPLVALYTVTRDQPEVWTTINGSGGWVHPMHMHQEEHIVLFREHSENLHPDDTGKSDTVNLDSGESVTFYRNFRTFTGRYVAHCHQLAHEDHSMMFGWEIVDPAE
jgi:FtsP/CotA-like multicopper oxidase with cupredoxin domain